MLAAIKRFGNVKENGQLTTVFQIPPVIAVEHITVIVVERDLILKFNFT